MTDETQQEAEQDARAEEWLDGVERRAEVFGGGYYLVPASDWLGVLDCFRMGERLLAVAVRERDQARDALRQIVNFPFDVMSDDAADFIDMKSIADDALAAGETVNQKPKGHTA